ncbi:MAG TPA: ABC transporter substrate-binding protein [Bacillota bacterium]|nr:ABC transporter substrate-binding protein [Bacillota bacterium]
MKKSLRVMMILALVLVFALSNVSAAKNQLVIGLLGDNETLNPLLSENFNETEVIDCIFSRLLRMNDKLQMEPDLLTKMPTVSKDNLTYSFQLRKGVKFHDGVELTSDDVKFLYDMAMAPGNAIPSREMWEKISKFEITDKYNFKITLKKPDAPWLENWCYTGWSIMPKHILEKEFKEGNGSLTKGGAFSRKPIGSGPYRFVEWKTDQYTMLKKNPNYFIKGQPKIDTLVFKVVPDTNGLLAQFKNNEIDVFPGAQPSQYKELMDMKTKGANIQVFKDPNFTYMHADFNFNHPALKEKVVRQALCYAFPKLKFIDTVLEGIGTPADSNIVPMSWAYTSNVHKYEYDPEKAKKMLDDAGWKVGADGVRVKKWRETCLYYDYQLRE